MCRLLFRNSNAQKGCASTTRVRNRESESATCSAKERTWFNDMLGYTIKAKYSHNGMWHTTPTQASTKHTPTACRAQIRIRRLSPDRTRRNSPDQNEVTANAGPSMRRPASVQFA